MLWVVASFVRPRLLVLRNADNNRRPASVRMLRDRIESSSLDGEGQHGHSAEVIQLRDC